MPISPATQSVDDPVEENAIFVPGIRRQSACTGDMREIAATARAACDIVSSEICQIDRHIWARQSRSHLFNLRFDRRCVKRSHCIDEETILTKIRLFITNGSDHWNMVQT